MSLGNKRGGDAVSNHYEVKLENDRLLQTPEFVEFLVKHQGQHIVLHPINEGHCLRSAGVYDIIDLFDYASVTIDTCNALESHDVYKIHNAHWSHWFSAIDGFDFTHSCEWNRRCVFGALYGRPSSGRLGIAGFLAKNFDQKSKILTNFDFSNSDSRSLFDLQRLYEWDSSAPVYLDILNDCKYISPYQYRRGSYCQTNALSYEYRHFFIDVVVEAVTQGQSFFPTEKIVRAILCRRPFVVMATQNYLDYLHQMGFHSFNEFWSEDYDGYQGKERYRRILELLTDLGARPQSHLVDTYYDMKFQLDHNFDLLVSRGYTTDLSCI